MISGDNPPVTLSSVRVKTLDARRVVPVFFVSLLVTAAVVIIDLMLVDVARHHRSDAALQMFERGQSEMRQGNTAAALELFRSAHNQSPSNSEYHLAFARGLRANGLEREGQAAVERLLSQLPSHGGANAEMARILAHAGDWERAAWFYHRSLYGEWSGSPDLVLLRFELADLLAKHGADGELLAEVVLLETLGGPSLDRRHLARLLLAAKAWTRAERQYQMLLRSSPAEADLLAGLARAQFGAGKYLAAERTFRRALDAGGHSELERDLDLTTRINDLDPSLRRLSAAERHRRAHEITSILLGALQACSSQNALVVSGLAMLERHRRVRDPAPASEEDLQTFEELWDARDRLCTGDTTIPREIRLLAAEVVK